jgi:hypothetical protein
MHHACSLHLILMVRPICPQPQTEKIFTAGEDGQDGHYTLYLRHFPQNQQAAGEIQHNNSAHFSQKECAPIDQ